MNEWAVVETGHRNVLFVVGGFKSIIYISNQTGDSYITRVRQSIMLAESNNNYNLSRSK